MSINLDELEDFEITVVSSKESEKQAHVPIAVAIQGSEGQSEFQILSELPLGAKVDPQQVHFKSVGEPKCIIFKSYEDCHFEPETIDLVWKKSSGD